ncbi:MAG: hypothetical protein II876_03055 [Synergistaceae bacterium]|nr:hypothetical protein [Synergistaceae bacterium]
MRTNQHIMTSDFGLRTSDFGLRTSDFGRGHNYSLKSINPSINLPAFLHWVKIGFWNDGTGLLW